MKRDDLFGEFEFLTEVSKALNISRSNITEWAHTGIPILQQLRIEQITDGRLQADRQLLADELPEILEIVRGWRSHKRMRGG